MRNGTKSPPNRRRLTDAHIRHIKPGPKKDIVWDTGQTGLGLLITSRGVKSYKVVYRHLGRLRWYTLGRADALPLADARRLARKILGRVADGQDPQAEKVAARVAARTHDTFAELAAEYVERHAKTENKSWRQSESLVRRYVLPKIGRRKVPEITRADVRRIFDDITARQRPVLANQVLAATSAIFSWALKRDRIALNPAKGIEGNTREKVGRYLSAHEIKQVWPAFETLGYAPASVLRLILTTAQRPGEVCAMRWQDINFRERVWTLPGLPEGTWPGTKNGRTHDVPLSELAVSLLDDIGTATEGHVFPGLGGRAAYMQIPSSHSILRSDNQDERAASIWMRMRRGWTDGGRA